MAVTAAMLAAFRASEHLRGSDGKFISMGGKVDVLDRNGNKRRGTVVDLTPSGPRIKYDDTGKTAVIPSQMANRRISAAPAATATIPTGNRVDGARGVDDFAADRRASRSIPGTGEKNQAAINEAERKFGLGSVEHDAAIGQLGGKPDGPERERTLLPGETPPAAPTAPPRRRAPAAAPATGQPPAQPRPRRVPANPRPVATPRPAAPRATPARQAPAAPKRSLTRRAAKAALDLATLGLTRTASGWTSYTDGTPAMPVTPAMLTAAFVDWQHPRDLRGRFIQVGDVVDVKGDGGKRRGTVTGVEEGGVEVTFDGPDGNVEVVKPKAIEVAPEARGRLESPDTGGDAPAAAERKGMGDIPLDPGTVADLRAPSRGFPQVQPTGLLHTVEDDNGNVSWTPERQALHDEIIGRMLQGKTSVPNPAYNVMGGGPAAGKSSMVRGGTVPELLDENSVMVNADEMKLELPEWNTLGEAAAAATHEESSYLAKRLQAAAFENSYNTTLDGTGDGSLGGLTKKIDAARAAGYAVNGFYVTIPTDEAVRRSDLRAIGSGRVVPASVISATHIEVSKILPQAFQQFDQVRLFDNTSGLTPVMTWDGASQTIDDQALWDAFTLKGNESIISDVGRVPATK